MKTPDQPPQPIYRKDYREPDYWIDDVDLEFELGEDVTLVRAKLEVRRNEGADAGAPLVLDGTNLVNRGLRIDGQELDPSAYVISDKSLRVAQVPERFTLETVVEIAPQDNTELSGLYRSSGNFCTQCEAEGFRRITWFLDRPDVMARYRVKITGDASRYPVLLSNGNRIASGDAGDGRHWVQWEDPFPKPSYLFALVAGTLSCHAGGYRTASGRDVRLEIWVEPQNIDKCEHALRSLQRAMDWDERTFGLDYDLDLYMIVAVGDFNMGAMENKGLNIFNSKYVLARPETATDDEYEAIESVIAHEYFHNWTGNRVTCRDWFQLTLKEGLTVFRDQQFSMDMHSAAVNRIDDVRGLRLGQFAEDAGPMAHPIRPEYYIEMNNFYTATVYQKGAEVVRMYQTLLGRDGFRKGMDLYFERHDGSAVTCDDFRAAMADASGADLDQLERWYLQAGTPTLRAHGIWNADRRDYRLTLSQEFPVIEKLTPPEPALMPVAVGLLDADGNDVANRVLELREAEQTFTFAGIDAAPTPSILRGFSAPAKLEIERSDAELAFLAVHDSDAFNRWEAGQELAQRIILGLAATIRNGGEPVLEPLLADVFAKVLDDASLDGSMRALALTLPAERFLIQSMEVWEPDSLFAARDFVRRDLAHRHETAWRATYDSCTDATYVYDKPGVDRRRLKNKALGYLSLTGAGVALAAAQFEGADNMTDSQAALRCLADIDGPERTQALQAFYDRWHDDPLVLDKWFQVQALSNLPGTAAAVAALRAHRDFSLTNPNRVRAVVGAFAMGNQVRFHGRDGQGYALLADTVLELDDINPQVASRLVSSFNLWRKFDEPRQKLMHAELERIAAKPKLSKDVYEIVGRALAGC